MAFQTTCVLIDSPSSSPPVTPQTTCFLPQIFFLFLCSLVPSLYIPGPVLSQNPFLLSLGHLPSYLGFSPYLHIHFYVHDKLGSANEREHVVFVFQFYLG